MSALQSPTSPADDQARPSFPNQLRDTLKASSADGDLARVQDILQIWNFQYASYKPEDLTPALNSAILRGELSVVRLLLESGAATEGTANSLIWDNPDSLAIFEAMVQHGWRVDSVTSYVTRALVMNRIMLNQDAENLLRFLLSKGAPVNGLITDPGSPLRWAPNTAIARILLSNGAILKHSGALHAAAYKRSETDSLALMNLYLDNGANINELGFKGSPVTGRGTSFADHGTALHVAANTNSVERVKLLINRGADLKIVSKNGYTARDWAQLRDRRGRSKPKTREYLEGLMIANGISFEDVIIESDDGEDE